MAWTNAMRTGGFAALVSVGSWNRVSPYATKRNGTFTSTFNSVTPEVGEAGGVDFFVQAVSGSKAVTEHKTTRTCVRRARCDFILEAPF
jgi:hypothetical protein